MSLRLALKVSCGTRWYGGTIGASGSCRVWKLCTLACIEYEPPPIEPLCVRYASCGRLPTEICLTRVPRSMK